MNQTDSLNAVLTLSVSAEDYMDERRKMMNDYRRKADIKGFRKGMAPMSLIERIYGYNALVDSVNEAVSKALNGYINDNKLNIIGEPLPSENQPENDWKAGNAFDFSFDIALYPDIDFTVGAEDSLPYYRILPGDEARKDLRDNMLGQFGNLVDGESVGKGDFIVSDISQGGETKVEGTYVSMRNVAEGSETLFLGLKPGQSVDVNVTEAFANEADRAAMLHVKKEELAGLDPVYTFTVKSVKTFKPAELCQETYDRIFGADKVHSEEEFEAKVEERLVAEYAQESDYRFSRDARKYFMDKARVELPSAFIKRWLVASNEGKYTAEDVEKDFDGFLDDFRWQCVRDHIARKFDLKVEQEDLLEGAKQMAAYQFAMYGMYDVPQENLEEYAKRLLADEKEGRRIVDQVEESKVFARLKAAVTLDAKDVTLEEFRALSGDK